ncbi:carotenoid biosynthesis protein [Candidatus Thorarchaeota archaeon]|nr:MAG: carotenoid biosynthesis protein [Candidatus Thorarchaeota archaeon]
MKMPEKVLFLILVVAMYVTMIVAKVLAAPVGFYGVLTVTAFVIIHGIRFYGWKTMLIFVVITFLLSWSFESLSIATGFPFGNYYYTGLGKIGEVPWVIMPGYLSMGYLSWLIAHILTGHFETKIDGSNMLVIPFIASFVMVMWDVVMDPIMSTIQGEWVFPGGGFYFGVPLTNYFGWFLTIFLIYLVFALFLSKQKKMDKSPNIGNRLFWIVIPIMYLGMALQYLLAPFFATANPDIYWSLFLVAIYTMVFVSLITIHRVYHDIKGN